MSIISKSMQKAVFLDRDGVVNRELEYIFEISDFEFIPGVFEACKIFKERGFQIFIVTNQSGIARGYYSVEQFLTLNIWMCEQFDCKDIHISGTYFCPHHPKYGEDIYTSLCDCRKPLPGMILQAAREHNIDLSQSILFGDKLTDLQAGRNAQVKYCVLLRSGHFISEDEISLADISFDSLGEIYALQQWLNQIELEI
jgi:D-glycero-D-manno-heptose 1,7-bisphosphate phosphatase